MLPENNSVSMCKRIAVNKAENVDTSEQHLLAGAKE